MVRQTIPDIQARELLATGDGVIVNTGQLERLLADRDALRDQLAAANERAEKAEAVGPRVEVGPNELMMCRNGHLHKLGLGCKACRELAVSTARTEKAEAELTEAKEELRRRHCYPLMGQTTAEAIKMAFDNGDSYLESVMVRAKQAEAERDALAARVAELEGAIQTSIEVCDALAGGPETAKVFPLKPSQWRALMQASLDDGPPSKALARVKAAAIREANTVLNSNVLGNGDYYAGMEAGIESAKNTLEEMAELLEAEAANG